MSSYRLTESRTRPPPLRLKNSSYTPRDSADDTANQTLLYDLPPNSSNPLLHTPVSPTNSTYNGRRSSAATVTTPTKHARHTTTTPPHPRSTTPSQSQVLRQDLDEFAANCRAMFYDQDPHAEQAVRSRLDALRPSERAQFAKLQASIRASYHSTMAARRKAEFNAHLTSTYPGCSLSPASRLDPSSRAAARERYDKFSKFVSTWCTTAFPGTTPFFEALWAVLRLQTIPIEAGGAGDKRIEWQFDDAVFREAAGKGFMLEAIDVLKGVLAFEESLQQRPQYDPPLTMSTGGFVEPRLFDPNPVDNPSATRPRAPSDPFLDTPRTIQAVSHSAFHSELEQGIPKSASSSSTATQAATPTNERDELLSPRTIAAESSLVTEGEDEDDQSFRVWVVPDLPNPEISRLLSTFPTFISNRTLPRFTVPTPPKNKRSAVKKRHQKAEPDLERGEELVDGKETLQCGTGSISVSSKNRAAGWRGNWWHNFVAWLHRFFC